MITLQAIITMAYYALTAGAAALLVYNFVKAKSWEREVLYLIALVPFVLRLTAAEITAAVHDTNQRWGAAL